MSTSNKLTYLNETKQELKQKINNLGGSIDEQTTFRNYANQLQNVYDNLPKTEYQEGTEVNLGVTSKGKLDYDNGVVGIGQSSQDGTPTPDNEVPIQCVTGNQEIVESGKNLFEPITKIGNDNIVVSNCTLSVSNGEFTFNATGTDICFGQVRGADGNYANDRGIKIYRNGNEKISFELSNSNLNRTFITAYNSNNVSLGYSEISSYHGTYTFPANCEYITFRFGKGNAVSGTTYKTTIMVAYGDTIPDYEPYHTPITYPISLGNNKFYKIGDYADELLYDVENDKVYKYEKIGKVVLNGSEGSWSVNHRSNGYQFDRPISTMKNGVNNVIEVMSNYFKGIAFNSRDSINESIYSGNNDKNIRILTNIATTINDFTTWLSTHNLKFYYVLETPTLTEITDQTLINQVKALYNAHSNNGTTIITSNGDLPMIIKVRALKGE